MTGNCIGWLAYSFITLDLFVFFANAPGLLISIWLNVGAMKLQYYQEIVKISSIQLTVGRIDEKEEENGGHEDSEARNLSSPAPNAEVSGPPSTLTSHELKLLQIVIIWILILSLTSLIPISKDDMKFVVGVSVNLNLIFFYAAPLSSIATVFRTKNSASIHFATMVMNTTNSFFWCVYSLAIRDYYILIPNGLGFLFGITQTVLYKVFPRSEVITGDSTAQFFEEARKSQEDDNEII